MNEESSVNKQLNAIVDGFTQRIGNGVIPTVDAFERDSTKLSQAASIITDKGLKLKVYASKKVGAGTIEDITLGIEDYGDDIKLAELSREKNGILLWGIEVNMHHELRSDEVGEGRLINPPGEFGSGTHTSTFTCVSPIFTQALMERIPLMSSK